MPLSRIIALTALGLALGGCVRAETGYWDARLAEMNNGDNLYCRYWLGKGIPQEAKLYCPRDMPMPPNGVWRPGLPGG